MVRDAPASKTPPNQLSRVWHRACHYLVHQRPCGPRERTPEAMEEDNVIDINMKGAPACGRCFMLVARYAPQVEASTGTYHRECYEAWYFGRFGRRPRLSANGSRHQYQVRDK